MYNTLLQTALPSYGREATWFQRISIVIAASMLITLSAKISVPFYPVNMNMQTFVILFLGMALGWRMGLATVLAYLMQGAVGLPVFTGTPEKGIGLAYMFGPTGGYLLGFVFAMYVLGWFADRGWDRSFLKTLCAMLAANIVIYVPGLLWLGTLFGWDKPILEWGLYPFILGDALKLLLASAALPLLWTALSKYGKSS